MITFVPVISVTVQARDRRDFVRLEQHRDAAGELFDDLVLAADHRTDIDRRIRGRDAMDSEVVGQVVELLGRIQQCLGRDAADVEAGAAECGLAVLADEGVDAGGLETELRGADRRDVAGRAGADHHDVIVLFAHLVFLVGQSAAAGGGRLAASF
jgi:hypothetical protein